MGIRSPVRIRPDSAVLVAIALLLGGCSRGYFDSTISRHKYDGQQRPASIQVSDPQLYKRENLINERREEYEYLTDLLAKSRTIDFVPELVRDIETISALSLQLGLSFDAGTKLQFERATQLSDLEQQIAITKLQAQLAQVRRDLELMQANLANQTTPSGALTSGTTATTLPKVTPPGLGDAKEIATRLESLAKSLTDRLDKPSVAPRLSAAGVSPRELFQDRQAYRRDIQSALNSTALDELHDRQGNSLFRLQFRATVLPEEAADELGVLQMQIRRPAYAAGSALFAGTLEKLYREWLDHVRNRLNTTDAEGRLHSDPTLLQLATEQNVFVVLDLTVPRDKGGVPAEPEDESAKPKPPQAPAQPPPAQPVSQDADKAAGCKMGFFQYVGEPPPSCHTLRIPFPASFKISTALDLHTRTDGFSNTWLRKMRKARSEMVLVIQDLPGITENVELSAELKTKCAGVTDRGTPVRQAYEDSLAITVGKHTLSQFRGGYTWAISGLGPKDRLAALAVADRAATITGSLNSADNFVRAYRQLQARCRMTMNPELAADKTEEKFTVPDQFRDALFELDTNTQIWSAKGRVSTYAVSPTALAQRVSTAARAADAIQLAAALAGALPARGLGLNTGIGAMRSVSGRADTIERAPLIIGYSTPAFRKNAGDDLNEPVFGWLLGPRVVLDAEKNALALEHHLAPYDLTADVSMPGWWPDVEIRSEAAWAPNWRSNRNTVISAPIPESRRTITMPMRHSKGDLDGVTALVVETQEGVRLPTPSIAQVDPSPVSDCVQSAIFLVRGSNIWRATAASLLGVPGKNISVLPDMEGISVTFDIASLPAGSGMAKLLVATPHGVAPFDIPVRGSRLVNNCAVTPKPAITSVLPGTIYACDAKIRLLVSVDKDFPGVVTKVHLGLIPATHSQLAGNVLEVTIDDAIDQKGGKQTTLPLILTTTKGVVSKDVNIERDDCKNRSSLPVGAFAVPYPIGSLDVCSKEPTVLVVGDGVKRIDRVQAASAKPQFNLISKSVRIIPAASAAELTFVAPKPLPKDPPTQIKLILLAGQKVITTLDVPAFCGGTQSAGTKE
jgi:hypothetical protein